ncbi:hypothetical protein Q73_04525 [Bacillus coahuilensis m2-6]|nr:hypothetical protein Q73_04525 [Bacillus coahuilensis m2-6]
MHSLVINEGITFIIGESGGGKSTILKLINRYVVPTEGNIYYHEQPITAFPIVSYRRKVPLLSQTPFFSEGSIEHNLQYGRELNNNSLVGKKELEDLLTALRLSKGLQDESTELSGGEKQRVNLGRFLSLDAKVYLMDEPCSSLDEELKHDVYSYMVDRIRQKGASAIIVTHSEGIAKKFADTIIRVQRGHLNV